MEATIFSSLAFLTHMVKSGWRQRREFPEVTRESRVVLRTPSDSPSLPFLSLLVFLFFSGVLLVSLPVVERRERGRENKEAAGTQGVGSRRPCPMLRVPEASLHGRPRSRQLSPHPPAHTRCSPPEPGQLCCAVRSGPSAPRSGFASTGGPISARPLGVAGKQFQNYNVTDPLLTHSVPQASRCTQRPLGILASFCLGRGRQAC